LFISRSPEEDLRWVLNGRVLEKTGKVFPWYPAAGVYSLALQDRDGKTVDSVHFEVRGPGDAALPLP
jgi:hypothetical protein